MIELENILQLWEKARNAGQDCVLATVVKTQGSSYRLPGARLLLTPQGERAGSISGGCLEEDLLKRAWWLTESGPMVRRYDTTPDGEISIEYGLGCNGIIHVLLERVTPTHCLILELLAEVRRTRKPITVTHVLAPPSQIGTRPDTGSEEETEESFVERLTPPLQLVLCGAGEDAVPVNRLAQFLGWQVYIYDGRSHYARPERFPGARAVIVRPTDSAVTYPHDPWTVAVIMTHSYAQDLTFLSELSQLSLAYLGVLGPQKRTHQLLADMELSSEATPPALHAPMGLDIGADGPEQVALSVVAEIQASLNRRDGGQLRYRAGSIHAEAGAAQPASDDENRAFIPSFTCV